MPGRHGWTFITSHAAVLIEVSQHPNISAKELAANLDMTERQAWRILRDLLNCDYIDVTKEGIRNRYIVNEHASLRRFQARHKKVKDLINCFR